MNKIFEKKARSIRKLNKSNLLLLSTQPSTTNNIMIELNESSENIKTKNNKNRNNPIKKGKWSAEEDKLLEDWVKEHGQTDWKGCSRIIQGRTFKQCREHWNNCVNPDLIKGKWTPEEDFLIMYFYHKCDGSWKKIIPLFNGRIENSIKNRFYTQLRKYATKNMNCHDRRKLWKKIKLGELKNYINEALINAKADLLLKTKMTEEELNLFIENNSRKLNLNIDTKIENIESNYNSCSDFMATFKDEELNKIFKDKKINCIENEPNINDNRNMNNNYLLNHDSDESMFEFGSKYIKNNISKDNNDPNNNVINFYNKNNNDINNNVFNIINYNNREEEEHSIESLEYEKYKFKDCLIDKNIKDNY